MIAPFLLRRLGEDYQTSPENSDLMVESLNENISG